MRDVIAALRKNATAMPDRVAISGGGQTLTWINLARRVAGLAGAVAAMGPVIGVLAENSIDWVVADLAIAASGHTFVPLPTMFSDDQLTHIVKNSGVGPVFCDAGNEARARRLCKSAVPFTTIDGEHMPNAAGEAKRIIYTSGTTGEPKGVLLGDRQLCAMAVALADAIGADGNDRYMSVLPFSLLLEELCGIHVPVLVGGQSHIAADVLPAVARGDMAALADAADVLRPTVSVLVPELLGAWVGALMMKGRRGPDSLRYVAVGGAPVSTNAAQAAWALGVPVYEGYGLSECCSVVALNRPDARIPGTVGKPVGDVTVTIEDGEIVVEGPTVMDGYLGGDRASGRWHTGDRGYIDDGGRLVVQGRCDNLLVTASGRNIQPEWIETMLVDDPRIARAIVIGHGAPHLTAVIVPTAAGAAILNPDDSGGVVAMVAGICASAPGYAVPRRVVVLMEEEMRGGGLLSPGGRPRRHVVEARFGEVIDPIQRETG